MKKIITYLLGAGASVEAGVPAAKEMVKIIYRSVKQSPGYSNAIETAIGGLRLHKSISHRDPFGDVDVEDLYEILRILADRHAHLLAPFVGSWSHAIASAERPNFGNATDRFTDSLAEAINHGIEHARGTSPFYRRISRSELDRTRCALSEALDMASGRGVNIFSLAADAVLYELINLSTIDDVSRVEYLIPFVSLSKDNPMWIATLNYDNTIELAAKKAGLDVDVGVESKKNFVKFGEESSLTLAKLHGSVDWSFTSDGSMEVGGTNKGRVALVFGAGNKLRIDGPYLDLLFAFRTRLDTTDELLVMGYSFRDQHINHLILNWIEKNKSRKVTVVDPSTEENFIRANITRAMPHGWMLGQDIVSKYFVIVKENGGEWISKNCL
jgi:hypothetical protein